MLLQRLGGARMMMLMWRTWSLPEEPVLAAARRWAPR